MPKKSRSAYKLYLTVALMVFLVLLTWFVFSGENFDLLKSLFVNDFSNDQLRDKLKEFGWRGYIATALLSAIQVVCTFLSAEPVQVLAGITFGFPVGVLCCLVGVLIGNTVVFSLHKTFGDRLRSFFVKNLRLDLDKIARSNRCALIIFILYFLPAIPYGMICFFAASTGMRYRRYITVTVLGSFPSICIGVALGYVAIASHRALSIGLFAVLIALVAVMFLKRDALFAKLNRFADTPPAAVRHTVRETNGFVLNVVYAVMRLYYRLCGVRVKTTNRVGKPQTPSIVLCNHGSFIDFIFAASLLRQYKPHFIVARLYFYNRYLRWLITTIGGFPKSMFAMDTESTKNCLTVLKKGGILAMMPEARLSTAGRFEDVQESTYSFIKKMAVPVYTVKFGGDYLADPKWGKGFRRGAVVEAELDILYTADDVKRLETAALKRGIEERLYYDEFAWLQQRPNLAYRSPRMAEGLENILTRCPRCNRHYTLTTKKQAISCEHCGLLTSIDNRYSFTGGFRFHNLAEWYDWQTTVIQNEIAKDEHYTLFSKVELRLSGNGSGLTRHSGEGVCTLSREGFCYEGTKDGENVHLHFPLQRVYRLLFGAGKNFELYDGTEILFFVPEEPRSAVDWYIASKILYNNETGPTV